uniref:MATH domain-containing protein n=1 Tax=Globodera pallida TaxID=36090 RepID=A0A183CSD0_GLOPA
YKFFSGGPSKAPKWEEDKDENESHSFHSKKNGWGFEQDIKFEELVDPPDNGGYDTKNDTVVLSADVTAEEPTGVECKAPKWKEDEDENERSSGDLKDETVTSATTDGMIEPNEGPSEPAE